jgi:mono/diheme cytochrome c family protein
MNRPAPTRTRAHLRRGVGMLRVFLGLWIARSAPPACAADEDHPAHPAVRHIVEQYCVDCHNPDDRKGALNLENVLEHDDLSADAKIWEQVVRRLRARQMPPAKKERPDENGYRAILTELESSLERAAEEHPNPGRTDTFRRLNRSEYQNAIRDLLAVEIDATMLLPKDDAGHGFDNVTVGTLSPTLLDRYISAAQKISQLAVGRTSAEGGDTIRIRPDVTQEAHVEGLPLGTRGGALIPYTFPQEADYEFQVRLARDRNEEVEGLREPHEVEILIDGQLVKSFVVEPRKNDKNYELIDQHLRVRVPVPAGPHQVGVTFVKKPTELLETRRQPYSSHFNMHRHPRISPAVYQVSINGPYSAKGPGDTPSRRRIFIAQAVNRDDEEACARKILSTLLQRAYRRPVTDEDLAKPLEFFRTARDEAGFDAGMEAALSAILVSPHFLFRVERDPPGIARGTAYQISDLELASRLSFFLWSSIPDEELLATAMRGELHQNDVLEKQVQRMLADGRAQSLVDNFAGQWLHLRNLESFTPDLRLFPDFDDNLRTAFRKETEMLFAEILRNDRSVLDLLKSDHTFLNERLARHYGVPHVIGSRFRKVAVDEESHRGGILRQGSVLAVTSYATRTSPVIRGNWILTNIIGTPPPPPLPNVPALKDNTVSGMLSVRERLAEHRANATCATCHNLMDPIGFALENFDAVGRWRNLEEGKPVEAGGGLPDGSEFSGVAGLEEALLAHPEVFVGTLAEKLLTFALGRGVEHYDGPAIRKVVREARENDYRFSSVIAGLVRSTPFTMRKSP